MLNSELQLAKAVIRTESFTVVELSQKNVSKEEPKTSVKQP